MKRINLKDLAEYVRDKGFIVQSHCYKCNKIIYGNEKGAKVIAAEMAKRGKGHSYVYECPKIFNVLYVLYIMQHRFWIPYCTQNLVVI